MLELWVLRLGIPRNSYVGIPSPTHLAQELCPQVATAGRDNTSDMSFQCELCGLLFPSEKNLSTHRSKFCAGSDLHKRVGSRLQQQMVEESVQPAAHTRYLLEGGRPPEALGVHLGRPLGFICEMRRRGVHLLRISFFGTSKMEMRRR